MEEEKELVERELVISHLSTRLAKYQTRGRALAELNVELIDELETQKVNLKDINSYLTSELQAKELATGEMESRVEALAQALDHLRDEGQTRLRGVADQAQAQQSELRANLASYEREVQELDAFSARRDALDTSLSEKEALLEQQRTAHAERLEAISRKSATEKDRLKKELAQRIKDTKANMKAMTDAQLETTTKRTIVENEQMGSELVYQARQTEKLLDRNDHLAGEHHRMGGELGEAREAEQELAKRNHVYQKTIRTLSAKLGQQEEAVAHDRAAMARGDSELRVLTQRLEAVRRERDALASECDAAAAERDEAAAEVNAGSTARADCARFLEACAWDIDERMRAARVAHENTTEVDILLQPGRLEELSLAQRRRALDYLLNKVSGGKGTGGLTHTRLQQQEQGASPGRAVESGTGKVLVRPLGGGGGGKGAAGGVAAAILPPIRPTGGGSFTSGIGGPPTGGGSGVGESQGGTHSEGVYGGEGSSLSALFGAFPLYGQGKVPGSNLGGGGGSAYRDNGYGAAHRREAAGEMVDAGVQTVPSGEKPARWQEVAAEDALHQTWSAAAAASRSRRLPPGPSSRAEGGRVSIGGGDSFERGGMKQSYNFSGRRK
jgi:hypothetical protein